MEYQEEFKFLSLESIKRKNAEELKEDEKYFLKLNLLDKNYNPCSFMVFNKDLIKKLLTIQFAGLQLLTVTFDLVYTNNSWNVKLVDLYEWTWIT